MSQSLAELTESLVLSPAEPQLKLFAFDDERAKQRGLQDTAAAVLPQGRCRLLRQGEAVEPEGWIEADGLGRLDEQMFVCRAVGRSMEPTIRDGDFLVFRAKPTGSRPGKIVLAQYRGPADPDTGGAFTVKRYSSLKQQADGGGWRHMRVTLSPTNPDYRPIVLTGDDAAHVTVIAELVTVLRA